ncbi:MAG TPA: DinB family protein [Mucilaginibacter sp.]|nr:DinB family protein [Mucilaginibacter sp.]
MEKEFLQNILEQNKMTSSFSFNRITTDNADLRLNRQAASIGFIYRHVGETMNLFTTFFGLATDVQNTTMGATDTGQGKNIDESRQMVAKGYELLERLIKNTPEDDWLSIIDTPFFGKVTRLRLFSHVLFHTSHHAGQISLTLSKGGIVN